MTIRILIADDHKIVCDGLKALLEIRSIADLTRFAVREGLTSLDK